MCGETRTQKIAKCELTQKVFDDADPIHVEVAYDELRQSVEPVLIKAHFLEGLSIREHFHMLQRRRPRPWQEGRRLGGLTGVQGRAHFWVAPSRSPPATPHTVTIALKRQSAVTDIASTHHRVENCGVKRKISLWGNLLTSRLVLLRTGLSRSIFGLTEHLVLLPVQSLVVLPTVPGRPAPTAHHQVLGLAVALPARP